MLSSMADTQAVSLREKFDDKSEISESDNEQTESSRQQKILYEPTYRMLPKEERKFNRHEVEKIIHGILSETFAKPADTSPSEKDMVQQLSNKIKEQVLALNLERYKIVVVVSMGLRKGQGMRMVSRCIWDAQTDDFASSVYEDREQYAVACVYGMYHE